MNNDVDNDRTLEWLAQTAASHARAGADIIAPSDMMDGRVGRIRRELDLLFSDVPILSYREVRIRLYGPFREAAESTPQFQPWKYQMIH